jgi:hypothetical protein
VALENHFFIRHSFLLKLIISLLSLLWVITHWLSIHYSICYPSTILSQVTALPPTDSLHTFHSKSSTKCPFVYQVLHQFIFSSIFF